MIIFPNPTKVSIELHSLIQNFNAANYNEKPVNILFAGFKFK